MTKQLQLTQADVGKVYVSPQYYRYTLEAVIPHARNPHERAVFLAEDDNDVFLGTLGGEISGHRGDFCLFEYPEYKGNIND